MSLFFGLCGTAGKLVGRLAAAVALAGEETPSPTPPFIRPVPFTMKRDWPVSFVLRGRAGQTLDAEVHPQVLFRGEKLIATDDSVVPGKGTYITAIDVGEKRQTPRKMHTPTTFYDGIALGNGTKWDTCERGLSIAIRIHFVEDCTWYATVFGGAVL